MPSHWRLQGMWLPLLASPHIRTALRCNRNPLLVLRWCEPEVSRKTLSFFFLQRRHDLRSDIITITTSPSQGNKDSFLPADGSQCPEFGNLWPRAIKGVYNRNKIWSRKAKFSSSVKTNQQILWKTWVKMDLLRYAGSTIRARQALQKHNYRF